MKTRKQLIASAQKQLGEISQYLRDVTHWNKTRGKKEGLIDPDPDGSMERMAHALDGMIEAEKTKVISQYKCNLCGSLRTERDRGYWYNSYCENFGQVARFLRIKFNINLLNRGPG